MSNKISIPRLANPVYAKTWRALTSLYGGQDTHILDKPGVPAAYGQSGIGGVTVTASKYKVTYCLFDPITGDPISESEPSEASNAVTIVDGKVYVTLPKKTSKIFNGFRVYRYTSSSSVLQSPIIDKRVTASADDATYSTYYIPTQTVVIPYSGDQYSTVFMLEQYSNTDRTVYYKRNPMGATTYFPYPWAVGTKSSTRERNRCFMSFSLAALTGELAITDVTLEVTSKNGLSTTNGASIRIQLYNDELGRDPSSGDMPSLQLYPSFAEDPNRPFIWDAMKRNSTGNRVYVSSTTALNGTTLATRSVSLGSTSSQIAADVVFLRDAGKKLVLGLADVTEDQLTSNIRTVMDAPKLKVTTGTSPLNFSTSSGFLHMGHGLDTTLKSSCAVRFQNIEIPNAAVINNAYIKFTAFPSNLNSKTGCALKVRAEAADNSVAFTTSGNYTGRSKSTAQVNWTPTVWSSEAVYQSPNLTSLVQETVNRGGWASGNAMTIFLEDNGSVAGALRAAYGFDGSSGKAPELVVQFQSTQPVSTYKHVGDVLGNNAKVFIDSKSNDQLLTTTSLPTSSASDLILSNLQGQFSIGNPLSREQARISVSNKSSYVVPEDRILFITHVSSGDAAPVVLGSNNPVPFRLWKAEAPRGYALLSAPIPVGPNTSLSVVAGAGEIFMIGYLLDTSSYSNMEVWWRTLTTTSSTVTFDSRGYLMGSYGDRVTSVYSLQLLRDGVTTRLINEPDNIKYRDPNQYAGDGVGVETCMSIPTMLKHNDVFSITQNNNTYIWGLKIADL